MVVLFTLQLPLSNFSCSAFIRCRGFSRSHMRATANKVTCAALEKVSHVYGHLLSWDGMGAHTSHSIKNYMHQ